MRFAQSVMVLFVLVCGVNVACAQNRYVIVGTGGITGVYYPAGGSVCRMVNRLRDMHGIRCTVESTEGSIYNLTKLRERDLDFAVVQSDWHYHAIEGSAVFETGGAHTNLRSLFSLHAEPLTLVASEASGIKTLDDLKGKRFNIGNAGSGQRATMEVLMKALGWDKDSFSEIFEFNSNDQSKELCNGTFDAMVFVAGHPSASIKEATSQCKSRLIAVTGDAVSKLVADHEYYSEMAVPGGMYRGNEEDIPTFGVSATFVASSQLPENLVYEMTKSVFDNFESFKQLHPAFQRLTKKNMLERGLSAPFHKGAMKYYTEARLQP